MNNRLRLGFPTMQKYQLDQPLSPSRLSAINFSKQLWTQLDLKNLLILCIKEGKRWSVSRSTELQKELRAKLSLNINESTSPEPVKKELELVVDLMTRDLWQSIQKKRNHWEGSSVALSVYFDHIDWTDDGCVDSSASIRSMYLSQILPPFSTTWTELCDHCLEDCIKDLWSKLSKIEKSMSKKADSVTSLYWCYCMQNRPKDKLEGIKKQVRSYIEHFSLEENMLRDCFYCDKYSAVVYFWGLLDDEQKKRTIIAVCGSLPGPYPSSLPQPILLLFLVKQLSLYQLDQYWIKLLRSEFMLMKLLKWPCQDLFILALDESSIHHKSLHWIKIMTEIVKSIDSSFLNGDGAGLLYREIFHEAWERVMRDHDGTGPFMIILIAIWEIKDIALLNNVINDSRLRDYREDHISLILLLFKSENDPLKNFFFQEFMGKVLESEEERKSFKDEIIKSHKRKIGIDC